MIGIEQLRRYKALASHNQISKEDVEIIINEAIQLHNARKRVLDNYNKSQKEVTELRRQAKDYKEMEKRLARVEKKMEKLREKSREEI